MRALPRPIIVGLVLELSVGLSACAKSSSQHHHTGSDAQRAPFSVADIKPRYLTPLHEAVAQVIDRPPVHQVHPQRPTLRPTTPVSLAASVRTVTAQPTIPVRRHRHRDTVSVINQVSGVPAVTVGQESLPATSVPAAPAPAPVVAAPAVADESSTPAAPAPVASAASPAQVSPPADSPPPKEAGSSETVPQLASKAEPASATPPAEIPHNEEGVTPQVDATATAQPVESANAAPAEVAQPEPEPQPAPVADPPPAPEPPAPAADPGDDDQADSDEVEADVDPTPEDLAEEAQATSYGPAI